MLILYLFTAFRLINVLRLNFGVTVVDGIKLRSLLSTKSRDI